MNRFYGFLLIGVLISGHGYAQVDQIKSASSSHASSGFREGAGSSVGWFFADLFLQVAVSGAIEWQKYTLENRYQNPSVVSVELMLQAAVQPSQYYVLNPRLRANWGIFSTDFRQNYLLEESIDGIKHLRTDEWQILELNVVSNRNFILRMGGGFIHEGFNEGADYAEWTTALTGFSNNRKYGGMTEFRTSTPRNEWSAQFHYRVLERGRFQGYVTAGGVFQRYYSSVSVWGLQTGLMVRLH